MKCDGEEHVRRLGVNLLGVGVHLHKSRVLCNAGDL